MKAASVILCIILCAVGLSALLAQFQSKAEWREVSIGDHYKGTPSKIDATRFPRSVDETRYLMPNIQILRLFFSRELLISFGDCHYFDVCVKHGIPIAEPGPYVVGIREEIVLFQSIRFLVREEKSERL